MSAPQTTLDAWLSAIGLGQYLSVLRDNEVDIDVVAALDDADLKELGFSLGDRKRFRAAAAGLSQPPHAPPPGPRPAARGEGGAFGVLPERRVLTVLISDLVGSTELSTRLDPEELTATIAAWRATTTAVVTRHGGTIAQFLGDGVLAYYGYPHGTEIDAEQAVRAGLEIIATLGDGEADERLRARVGIATGIVVVGEQIGSPDSHEHLAIGTTPNLAARLQAIAAPGEVVISADTQRHVGRLFNYRALGGLAIKGLAAPVEAFAVLGETATMTRFEARQIGGLAPLVGRDEEADMLRRRWRTAVAGEGQVVLMTGEAGIGKSRLVEGLLATLAETDHARVRMFGAPHHTRSPLQPSIAQLRVAAGIAPDDTAADKLARLVALLGRLSAPSDADIALIAELLSIPATGRHAPLAIDAPQKRERTLDCLLRLAQQIAEATPAIIVVEDAHWVDPTSLDLLDRMVELAVRCPMLILVTSRPPFDAPWIGASHVTTINLNRLGQQDCRRLVGEIVGDALPAQVCDAICQRADGIPLFVEEITHALRESGALGQAAAREGLGGNHPRLSIPGTLRATLVARLDRLADARIVAQVGAAIGREFSYEMLAALAPAPADRLPAILDALVASGLITRRGVIPEAVFVFKHALVQDAAYSTLLHSRRRMLHSQIADELLRCTDGAGADQPDVIAHHLTQASRPAEAARQWRHAGQLAFERSALREAEALYLQCLDALSGVEPTPDTQAFAIDVRLEMRMVYAMLGEVRDALTVLQVADVIAQTLGDPGRQGVVNGILANGHSLVGDVDTAIVFGRRALKIADANDDLGLRFMTTTYLENTHYLRGDYEDVAALARDNLAALPPDWVDEYIGLPVPSPIYDRCWQVLALAHMGRFDEAAGPAEEALALAARSPRPIARSVAQFANATLRMISGDWACALPFAQEWADIDRRSNIVLHMPWSVTSLAWVRAELGEDVEAIRVEGEALLRAHEARGVVGYICWAYVALARAALACGDHAAARDLAERAVHASPDHKGFQAYALHLSGEIEAMAPSGATDAAARHFEAALALCRERHMAPLEAQCRASLRNLFDPPATSETVRIE